MTKVLVQFDKNGSYKESPWTSPRFFSKGQVLSVSPLYAMYLINAHLAHIYEIIL